MKNLNQPQDLRATLTEIHQKLEKTQHEIPDINLAIHNARRLLAELLTSTEEISMEDIRTLLSRIEEEVSAILDYQHQTMEMGKNSRKEMMEPLKDLLALVPDTKPQPLPSTPYPKTADYWRAGIEL
ncbi:MAG: hypothetical protein AB7J40_04660 [Candidatus Altimarinota bacterium]